jgi:polysaccharide chain length determinant protein (PEP-CTERM system associated)
MDNVLEGFVAKLRRLGRLCSKRRWLALGVSSATVGAAALLINTVPDRFEATARVYVDTQTVLKPLMANLTYQPDIDQQVKMLARTLISRPNIETLVKTPGLGFNTAAPGELETLVSRLMTEIKVVPTSAGNLYEITYRETSPQRAKRLVEATVALFVNTGAVSKKRDSEEAGRFIEEQIRTYEAQLTQAEDRLKQFRIRNFGVSGVSNQDYFARVSGLTEQVNKIRAELLAAERSRASYSRELALEDPQLPVVVPAVVAVASDLEVRLAAKKSQLDELLRRFTEAHPEVINAQNAVAQLEAETRRVAASALKEKSEAHGGKAATSPVYQKLRLSLAQADAEVASLRSQLATQTAQLNEVRGLAGRVPQVEAEHAQLNRDYDIVRKAYDAMVARRESAALGVKLDASAQLAEFRVVEPPRVSTTPAFPARLHWAALALVAALVLGVGATVAAEMASPTFEETAALQQVSGRPVIGVVSLLPAPQTPGGWLRPWQNRELKFASAFGMAVAAQAMWLGWIALQTQVN